MPAGLGGGRPQRLDHERAGGPRLGTLAFEDATIPASRPVTRIADVFTAVVPAGVIPGRSVLFRAVTLPNALADGIVDALDVLAAAIVLDVELQ